MLYLLNPVDEFTNLKYTTSFRLGKVWSVVHFVLVFLLAEMFFVLYLQFFFSRRKTLITRTIHYTTQHDNFYNLQKNERTVVVLPWKLSTKETINQRVWEVKDAVAVVLVVVEDVLLRFEILFDIFNSVLQIWF